jgi:secondary thiamine-phosphate synthase enzyme
MPTLTISTKSKRQIVDITDMAEQKLSGSGLANVFVAHTTAALTTADLDPGTDLDILDAIAAMTPDMNWRHPHDPEHFPDHLWASVIGPSVSIPYEDGKFILGTWQRLVLIEFDGPRERIVKLSLVG